MFTLFTFVTGQDVLKFAVIWLLSMKTKMVFFWDIHCAVTSASAAAVTYMYVCMYVCVYVCRLESQLE